MLNFMTVLQQLCAKVKIEKVSNNGFHNVQLNDKILHGHFNYLIFETYRLLRIFPIFPLFSKH